MNRYTIYHNIVDGRKIMDVETKGDVAMCKECFFYGGLLICKKEIVDVYAPSYRKTHKNIIYKEIKEETK